MPLVKLNGLDAIETMKSNAYARWPLGGRTQENRVEPIAKPHFTLPFTLIEAEPIYTIGSCFARHIEVALERRGHPIPTRRMLRENRAFEKFGPDILNSYGAPSIFNELSWALDPDAPYRPNLFIEEILPGRFADIHMTSRTKADGYEDVLARRNAILEVNKSAARCRVAIITLGLAEVWWDNKTGTYLNDKPRPNSIAGSPDRFELHVLKYEEAYHYLKAALGLLRKFGQPDLQVLLTVSPVPLMVTHRPLDVMVANSYSKAVLRCVAETATVEHDFVHYFPSYESVTLSDRKLAWHDDLYHIRKELVDFNIGIVVAALAGERAAAESETASAREFGDAAALKAEMERLKGEPDKIVELIDKNHPLLKSDSEVAALYCLACYRAGKYAWAREVGSHFSNVEEIEIVMARVDHAENNMDAVIERLTKIRNRNNATAFRLLVEAYVHANNLDEAKAVLLNWTKTKKRSALPFVTMARALQAGGHLQEARPYYDEALRREQDDADVALDYVQLLVDVRDSVAASALLGAIKPSGASQYRRFEQFKSVLH